MADGRSTAGRRDGGGSGGRIPPHAVLVPDRQPAGWRLPFPHQAEAWEALDAADARAGGGPLQGLVVMPTGSGKTFTAMTWAMGRAVGRGDRVIWLAHSGLLLEQAADAAHRAVGRAWGRDRVSVRIVSGSHCPPSHIGDGDDVVACSIPSLLRHRGHAARLLGAPGALLVVDEAHHAAAASYRELLGLLPDHRRLIGLTATPTRTRRDERPVLAGLFGGRIIHRVEHDVLVERGVLARPIPVRVSTGVRLDGLLGPDDLRLLEEHGHLDAATLRRLGRIEARNQLVVDHYLARRDRYGRSLVFAGSVDHAALLADRLARAGVRADYVAARRPDGGDDRSALDRFRDPGGDLEVLVSVGKLAEGADLPLTRTVILASPTGSEIRLRQMVGRALRGPAVGGTEHAYLVAFEDEGRLLGRRLDPSRLAPDLFGPAAPRPPAGRRARTVAGPPRAARPPWPEAVAAARDLRGRSPAASTRAEEAAPSRWYVLRPGGPDAPARTALAYGDQVGCWEGAIAHLAALPRGDLGRVDWRAARDRFFAGRAWPEPAPDDLDDLVAHYRATGLAPRGFDREARAACEPAALARLIRDGDLGERSRLELLEGRYGELAAAIYPTPRSFREAVDLELHLLFHPEERPGGPGPDPVFEEASGPGRGGRREAAVAARPGPEASPGPSRPGRRRARAGGPADPLPADGPRPPR
ncbi:Type III restriction enzyme, res subunit [Aquisphaera giovannonii]|uniref:Type III restriction enzyme, res subunit n=1 Tax=Aquisphaera giovannonii TaxID=406548 RepID=A0A5B9VW79_9BACT|nr:DEAD/DEAH box helicase [Aquisphaera giovannonii]QEH32111.1 Type III restriction enzyme, res subunit [Aquisphaera giovannonii]